MKISEAIIRDVGALREQGPMLDLTSHATVIHNLVWMHQVIVASEPLMQFALEQPLVPAVYNYLSEHINEERGHAAWLEDDLQTAGIAVRKLPLIRAAVELAGSQYYLIKHINPNALLGYMAVLEGFPVPMEVVEELESIHGKDLLRCLRYHAENDPEHRKALFKVLDKVDDPAIYGNAIRTQHLMNEAFRAAPQ